MAAEGGRYETPQKIEAPEYWTTERLAKRHRHASLLVELDNVLVTQDSQAILEIQKKIESSDFSPSQRESLIKILTEYGEMTKQATNAENYYKDNFNITSPTELGAIFYDFRTNETPSTTQAVTAQRHEGYFIIYCANPADYYKFAYPEQDQTTIDKNHAGTFHHAINIGNTTHSISVLLINHAPPENITSDATTNAIIIHERQHWINHKLLGVFEATERSIHDRVKRTEPDIAQAYGKFIKDEVLAHLRDGSSGTHLELSLSSDNYSALFPAESFSQKHKNILAQINSAIHEIDLWQGDKSLRPYLVMQLLDVPFDEIPAMLQKISHYYQENNPITESYEFDFSTVVGLLEILTTIYPSACNTEANFIRREFPLWLKHRSTYTPGELKTKFKLLSEAYEALQNKHNNHGLKRPQISYHHQLSENNPIDVNYQADAQQILRVIEQEIPQTNIDNAAQELKQHINYQAEKLGRQIAQVLREETGFWYDINITTSLDQAAHQLSVQIDRRKYGEHPAEKFVLLLSAKT